MLGAADKPLLSQFAFSGAPVQQIWGSGCGRPVDGCCSWWFLYTSGVAKVRMGLLPNHNSIHKEKKANYSCMRLPSERNQYVRDTLMLGNSACSLYCRTFLGNFLVWYSPWTITHYSSLTWFRANFGGNFWMGPSRKTDSMAPTPTGSGKDFLEEKWKKSVYLTRKIFSSIKKN